MTSIPSVNRRVEGSESRETFGLEIRMEDKKGGGEGR